MIVLPYTHAITPDSIAKTKKAAPQRFFRRITRSGSKGAMSRFAFMRIVALYCPNSLFAWNKALRIPPVTLLSSDWLGARIKAFDFGLLIWDLGIEWRKAKYERPNRRLTGPSGRKILVGRGNC